MYANFLEDKRIYRLAKAHWKRLFDRLVREYSLTCSSYINEADDYDGNPIFSVFVPEKNRAIRIIQANPEEVGAEIAIKAWLDAAAMPDRKTTELVIALVLTPTSASLGEKLIREWIGQERSEEEILQMIKEFIRR